MSNPSSRPLLSEVLTFLEKEHHADLAAMSELDAMNRGEPLFTEADEPMKTYREREALITLVRSSREETAGELEQLRQSRDHLERCLETVTVSRDQARAEIERLMRELSSSQLSRSPGEPVCTHPALTATRAWSCDLCGALQEQQVMPSKTAPFGDPPPRPKKPTRMLASNATDRQAYEHYSMMLDYWIAEAHWQEGRANRLNAELSAFLKCRPRVPETPATEQCKSCSGRGSHQRHSAGGYDQTMTCERCGGTGVTEKVSLPHHEPVAYDRSKTPEENVQATLDAPIMSEKAVTPPCVFRTGCQKQEACKAEGVCMADLAQKLRAQSGVESDEH